MRDPEAVAEASSDDDSRAGARPSLERTESGDSDSVDADSVDSDDGFIGTGLGPVAAPVRVAPIDAEHLRNAVASRLFGASADPVKIGRYTILTRLGAGAMGVVYAAYDTQLDRKIAVKLLRGVDEEGAHHARMTREAQALAKLSHPNVVPVFELDTF
ncbi:MAG: protein kinase, partial [Myxococcales bacterium]|nr:protein kinase [Myxococcales bacterium]